MKLIITQSYEESCRMASELVRDVIKAKPDAKLGLATGSTPLPLYQALIEMNKSGELDFAKVRTVNLDEYWGLAPDHPQSYRYFMDQNLFDHINIDKANTYVANGLGDPVQNAAALDEKIYENGPPDVQVLGIGNNGHIGFNEAGPAVHADSHIEALTQSTIDANARFFTSPGEVPTSAITMGMKGILASRLALLVATGVAKAEAVHGLLADDAVTSQNPATFLKLHPNAVVLIDEELAHLAGIR